MLNTDSNISSNPAYTGKVNHEQLTSVLRVYYYLGQQELARHKKSLNVQEFINFKCEGNSKLREVFTKRHKNMTLFLKTFKNDLLDCIKKFTGAL